MADQEEFTQLKVASPDLIKQELLKHEENSVESNAVVSQKADDFVLQILSKDLSKLDVQQTTINAIEEIGANSQQKAVKQLDLLKQPIGELSRRAEDGGAVANALIDLKITVESLDPAKVNFSPGWFSRILGYIPGLGTPIKRYLTKFESAQTTIQAIAKSLESGRDQLKRDNVTLKEDQKMLWESEKELEETLRFAQQIDSKIDSACQQYEKDAPNQVKFVQEYMLFPVRQRIIDLQQQLAVQQQSVISSEIIIRNNKELIRGVDRALNVTITALSNATTIAMALAHQEKVIKKVDTVNETTSKLIEDTARRLKTQGTQIHKQAASAQLNIESLKTALSDIKLALDDISNFRKNALPQMQSAVKELDQLIEETKAPLSQIKKSQEDEE